MFFEACARDLENHTDVILSPPFSVSPGSAQEQHPWSELLKDTSAGWIHHGKKGEREKELGSCSNQHVNRGGLGSRFFVGSEHAAGFLEQSLPVEFQMELSTYCTPWIHVLHRGGLEGRLCRDAHVRESSPLITRSTEQ